MDSAYYIHDLSPVLIHLGGPLAVRWYGLAYLLGFLGGFLILRKLSREGSFRVPEDRVSDFIVLLAVYGVLVGGRLGYVLFYGMEDFRQDPLFPFKLWQGGMASHGGMIGTVVFLVVYARKNGHTFRHLCDHVCLVVPVGLFLGRLANFINGELWGRVTDVSWAVIFPQEAGLDYTAAADPSLIQRYLEAGHLAPRHPSQLYEAFAEGLLVFAVLWWLRSRPRFQKDGWISAAFAVTYGAARIVVEFFREPDSTVYFGWMTKGQLLSLFLIAGGVVMGWYTARQSKQKVEA